MELMEATVDIVSAYLSRNPTARDDVAKLVGDVHRALVNCSVENHPAEPLTPAVPIKKSITPDAIICLEDGKRFKSLKRHLGTAYGMTPDEYRKKWGLDPDYPMVAPNYARARSDLAKQMGLGRHRGSVN
jgi:predicted transcriptional regulator